MALSGSTDYSVNRDELINQAYRILGALRTGGSATTEEISDATITLNMMLKAWQAYGLQLWVVKRATLIPTKGAQSYSLGGTGDHASLSMSKTEMRVAGVATDTTLEVDSTTGMTAADNIGIVLDDGTTQWTTINTVTDSDTVVIDTALTSAAAINQHIYWYTTKINRPHEMLEVYRRNYDEVIDVPVIRLSRTDFFTLSDKDTEGTIVNFYYDPQLTNSILHVWPTASSDFANNFTLELLIKKPFDDMDSATDDFEFPQEWYEAIVYGLAERIAPMLGYPIPDRQLLKMEAQQYLDLALTFDHEHTNVTFTADESRRSS